jgi:hypothetical protein
MRRDMNGLPYYMNHQVWRPNNDPRGLGGDQLQMALSAWQLLYNYTGNERVKENMKFLADYYLTHSLSPADAAWPDIPFPYNTLLYSGFYDGDMVIGKGYTQPDKAGSFGIELVKMYQLTGKRNYLDAAVAIANTLAKHTKPGDADNSPLPFKVNAFTGEVGRLESNAGDGSHAGLSSYTTNWSGTLQLFQQLIRLKQGDPAAYGKAFDAIVAWMKAYPLKTNKWGPFFEDIPGWSDTQINAVTFAQFMMENPRCFPSGKRRCRPFSTGCTPSWATTRGKSTACAWSTNRPPTRRPATATPRGRLRPSCSTPPSPATRPPRKRHPPTDWATYMVDKDGKNNYPRDEVWLTDGYGDYVRHYLRAMAAAPELSPHADHILHATTVLYQADYAPDLNKRLALESTARRSGPGQTLLPHFRQKRHGDDPPAGQTHENHAERQGTQELKKLDGEGLDVATLRKRRPAEGPARNRQHGQNLLGDRRL